MTTSLQAEAKDIVGATCEISSVKAALQYARHHIDEHHSHWFRTVERLCSDIGVEPSLPRCCGWQTYHFNVPSDTPSVYYCQDISIPLLGHLLSEMESHFNTHQQTALLGLSLVPSILFQPFLLAASLPWTNAQVSGQ